MEKKMSIERRNIVAKIGSESQETPEGFRAGISCILSNDVGNLVVSAMGGYPKVTNLLIACSPNWSQDNPFYKIQNEVREHYPSNEAIFAEIRRRYTSMGQSLGYHGLKPELDEVERIIERASRLDSEVERENYGYLIVSRGEWLSGHMWSGLLDCRFQDSTEFIRFRKDGQFDERSYGLMESLRSRKDKMIIPGFYGLGPDGRIRLFPRNGSDLTAAYIARGINAGECWILKGVDGVLSADPKILEKFGGRVMRIPEMTYGELRYGSFQVVHAGVIIPLADAGILLRVLNPERLTENPRYQGSLIRVSRNISDDEDVIGITGMDVNGTGTLFTVGLGIKRYSTSIHSRLTAVLDRADIEHGESIQEYYGIRTFILNICELDRAISIVHNALIKEQQLPT